MSQKGWARTAAPPASWMIAAASAASGQRRATKAFAPGTSHSSKKALICSGSTPAAFAMWGRPTEFASPASAIASSSLTLTPWAFRRPMISSARETRSRCARSQAGAIAVVSTQ